MCRTFWVRYYRHVKENITVHFVPLIFNHLLYHLWHSKRTAHLPSLNLYCFHLAVHFVPQHYVSFEPNLDFFWFCYLKLVRIWHWQPSPLVWALLSFSLLNYVPAWHVQTGEHWQKSLTKAGHIKPEAKQQQKYSCLQQRKWFANRKHSNNLCASKQKVSK